MRIASLLYVYAVIGANVLQLLGKPVKLDALVLILHIAAGLCVVVYLHGLRRAE
jgi:hypothetical protein